MKLSKQQFYRIQNTFHISRYKTKCLEKQLLQAYHSNSSSKHSLSTYVDALIDWQKWIQNFGLILYLDAQKSSELYQYIIETNPSFIQGLLLRERFGLEIRDKTYQKKRI